MYFDAKFKSQHYPTAPLGVSVFVSSQLPMPETVRLCDIETKTEFNHRTGNEIHCIKTPQGLMVSTKLYEQLKDKYSEPTKAPK